MVLSQVRSGSGLQGWCGLPACSVAFVARLHDIVWWGAGFGWLRLVCRDWQAATSTSVDRDNYGNGGSVTHLFGSSVQRSFTVFFFRKRQPNRYIPESAKMSAAQSLPRFLLPRLSWAGPLSTASSIPCASAVVFQHANHTATGNGWQASPRRSLHTNAATPAKKCATLGDNTSNRPTRSLSSIVRDPVHRRSFHASAARQREHHFDTLRFVQRLQEEGFTEEQSAAMMKVLNDVIEER